MGKTKGRANNEERHKALESGDKKNTLKAFDSSKKVINFRNLKATDLKNNKRITILETGDYAEEIRMNNVKSELKEVYIKYMKENCDNRGNLLENNLTVKQVKAIKELKTKMKNDNLVCVETDKTGKFALDTKENYMKKVRKHINMDEVISTKEVTRIETN